MPEGVSAIAEVTSFRSLFEASKHPARIEVLLTSANWNDGSQYMRIHRIIRDNEGKVIQLAELEDESGHSELGGRFTNFFGKV